MMFCMINYMNVCWLISTWDKGSYRFKVHHSHIYTCTYGIYNSVYSSDITKKITQLWSLDYCFVKDQMNKQKLSLICTVIPISIPIIGCNSIKIFTSTRMDSNKVLNRQKTKQNKSLVLVTQRNFPHRLRDQHQYDATFWQRT